MIISGKTTFHSHSNKPQLDLVSDGDHDVRVDNPHAVTVTQINAVPSSQLIASSTGLTGGGDLTADRTLALTGQALALHNLAVNGIVARTGSDTISARTITGTANQITVVNGDGVSGSPVLSLPALLSGITNIRLDDTPDTDDTFQGITMPGVAGEALTQWQLIYCRDVSGVNKWFKYDNTNATYKENVPMGMVTATAALDAAITVLLFGIVRNDGWGQVAADKGKKVYGSTAGNLTLTRPSAAASIIVIEGRVLSQNTILFNPSQDFLENA